MATLRAFIIRPFGTQKDINFDEVERVLIAPALDRLEIGGRTTIEIVEAGNIRIDMFQRLLTADLVVADLSIHNANLFYEPGRRPPPAAVRPPHLHAALPSREVPLRPPDGPLLRVQQGSPRCEPRIVR